MDAFTFPSYSIDFATGEVLFDYALTGPDREQRFTEVVTLPLPAEPVSDETAKVEPVSAESKCCTWSPASATTRPRRRTG